MLEWVGNPKAEWAMTGMVAVRNGVVGVGVWEIAVVVWLSASPARKSHEGKRTLACRVLVTMFTGKRQSGRSSRGVRTVIKSRLGRLGGIVR